MPQAQQQQDAAAPLVFEQFEGVNTATTRLGVQDKQAYWLDGFMPLSPRNLRTLPGIGTALYTAAGGVTIVCFFFYNLGATAYVIVFLSDGSAIQINTAGTSTFFPGGEITPILQAGTIVAPSILNIGVSQYGQQYLLIVANQPNGYWVWDGTTLFGAGGLAPEVTLTNVGEGYFAPPTITATGGSGFGATFQATISGGVVTGISVTNPGQGYLAGDAPTLVFTGGTQAGSSAAVTASLSAVSGGSSGSLSVNWVNVGGAGGYTRFNASGLSISNGGSGYSALTTAYFSGGSGPGWNPGPPTITLTISGGVITGATLDTSTDVFITFSSAISLPTIVISDPGYYYVTSTSISNAGSNYHQSTTTLTASSGGAPQTQATFSVTVSGGSIIAVTILNGGFYGSNTPPTLTVNSTTTTAAATISLMPFGIQGTAIETYQGHVWVFNGSVYNLSAPGSVTDFATSDGGGSDQSSASYLKVRYVQAVSTNGFLFILGDSSMDYISGVSTSVGPPPTTTFTQNNCDPEIGTPYPAAVTTLGQDILIANSAGIFVSSGGAFVKQSEPLDGVFNTVPSFNNQQLSAAKATIFGKRVWMVLVPIVDPVNGNTVNKLLMYNGRVWWASQQDVPLVYIAGQEINSVYTAWGTDGIHLYPLFNQPSTAFTKTAQSRLWDTPDGYWTVKAETRLWAIASFISGASASYTVSIDNENGVSATAVYTGLPNAVTWINASGATATWTNNASAVATWYITGANTLAILPPTAIGQQGVLTGMTVETECADMVLLTAAVLPESVQYRG